MNFDRAVEAIIKEAMERGEFDHLPGKGKPIDLSAKFALQIWPALLYLGR